ncbi:hypothetical protein trd_0730 [Thermomicrobium roseum DSM 5159]|uniref:Uncharacterized protein n=1 Tax=Thermomicrobium roseum (strain ATCC 27502 / DSM 5159 / P-2) TaxID=309801 RepID=B9KZ20_THERP|nr:hypothetical protein trd_0730 [Thermomicrobium roseum DSM 5159]
MLSASSFCTTAITSFIVFGPTPPPTSRTQYSDAATLLQ